MLLTSDYQRKKNKGLKIKSSTLPSMLVGHRALYQKVWCNLKWLFMESNTYIIEKMKYLEGLRAGKPMIYNALLQFRNLSDGASSILKWP